MGVNSWRNLLLGANSHIKRIISLSHARAMFLLYHWQRAYSQMGFPTALSVGCSPLFPLLPFIFSLIRRSFAKHSCPRSSYNHSKTLMIWLNLNCPIFSVNFEQIFQQKNLVIKMMDIGVLGGGGWAVGWVGFIISFPEHKFATLRNILMVLGRIIEQVSVDCRCKNNNAANLGFLITWPYLFFVLSIWPVSQ